MSKKNATKSDKAVAATKAAAPKQLEPNSPAASAPVTKTPVPNTRVSHLKLGPALLAAKATQAEIEKAFNDSFKSRGVTDAAFIAKRIKIYMHIAAKKAAAAAALAEQAATKKAKAS